MWYVYFQQSTSPAYSLLHQPGVVQPFVHVPRRRTGAEVSHDGHAHAHDDRDGSVPRTPRPAGSIRTCIQIIATRTRVRDISRVALALSAFLEVLQVLCEMFNGSTKSKGHFLNTSLSTQSHLIPFFTTVSPWAGRHLDMSRGHFIISLFNDFQSCFVFG